jgi:ABC-type transport system substrate-binding protein
VNTYPVSTLGVYHLAINNEVSGPLSDAKVRQAMSLAIDRDEINQKAFQGITPAAKGFMYAGVPETYDVLPNGGKRDVEAAKAMLASSSAPTGFNMKLSTQSARPGWTDAAVVIKGNLADIGITAEVQPVEDAVAVSMLSSGNYEAHFQSDGGPPLIHLRNLFSPGAVWQTFLHYKNSQIASLLDNAQVAKSSGERLDLMQQATNVALGDMPEIPLVQRYVLVGSRVDPKILYDGKQTTGAGPWVRTVAEMAKR